MIRNGGVLVGCRVKPDFMRSGSLAVELEPPLFELFDNLPVFEACQSRSLSDLGDRSEASGKWRTVFRSFEANSGDYLTKMIGKMDPFPTAAVDSS